MTERAVQYHEDHHRETEDDDQRINDREPMNLVGNGMIHGQVHVPARGPQHIRWSPLHIISKHKFAFKTCNRNKYTYMHTNLQQLSDVL